MIPSHSSPCGIFGGHSGTGTGFPLNVFVFSCQCHCSNTSHSFIFTDALYSEQLAASCNIALKEPCGLYRILYWSRQREEFGFITDLKRSLCLVTGFISHNIGTESADGTEGIREFCCSILFTNNVTRTCF